MSQDLQNTLAQVVAQLSTLSAVVAEMQAELSDTPDAHPLESSVCNVANKDGSVCKVTPVKGTSVCHVHTRMQAREETGQSKTSGSEVAKNTADLKANRRGAGIAAGDLDAEMQAGTGKIYFHSNGGCLRINKALRKRGWKVGNFTKHADGSRTWDVTGHGQAYTHHMGVYKQGQAEHHRQMIKA